MKKIVILCDGTGNEYGQNNTNVVLAYDVLDKTGSQLAFYDPGVGTGGWEYDEGTGKLQAAKDKATGFGLQKNVEDAYRLLMARWEPDDEVYVFGFSRGAFTARALAGMLYKVGLLGPEHENLLEYASKLYNTSGNEETAAGFKRTFGRRCPVHCIAVWDTVDSRLMSAGKRFQDARLNPDVKFGFHAVAVDERRKDFPVLLWDEAHVSPGQTIEQVWFPGVHCDVGGWYDERGLSNGALHWLLRKAGGVGLAIDEARLAKSVPDPHGKIHESYSGFWKFRGSKRRTIPEGACIHQSVIERRDQASNDYEPGNLPADFTVVA